MRNNIIFCGISYDYIRICRMKKRRDPVAWVRGALRYVNVYFSVRGLLLFLAYVILRRTKHSG